MNGVEILSATALTTWYGWTFGVSFFITVAACLIVLFSTKEIGLGIGAGIIAFLLCAIFFGGFGIGEYETGEYELKVTIDDSVSMNEFLDKYEILDQEGKIYTVKERE
jgi:hypothetical protein